MHHEQSLESNYCDGIVWEGRETDQRRKSQGAPFAGDQALLRRWHCGCGQFDVLFDIHPKQGGLLHGVMRVERFPQASVPHTVDGLEWRVLPERVQANRRLHVCFARERLRFQRPEVCGKRAE